MTDAELRGIARLLHGRPQAGEGSAVHHRRDVQVRACGLPVYSKATAKWWLQRRWKMPTTKLLWRFKPRKPNRNAPQAAASTPDLQPHQTILKDNQTGVSYRKLFAEYLKGANNITIQDPYIRMPYQFKNLLEFCLMLSNNKSPEDELNLEIVTWNDEEHLPDSLANLDETPGEPP